VPEYGKKPAFSWGSDTERAVMTFLAPHLADKDKAPLSAHTYRVRYLSYDWSLNEQ